MVSKKTAITTCLLVLIILAVVAYTVFVPVLVSLQYKHKVQAAVSPFEGSFQDLDKSTELPLVTNLIASQKIKKR